MLTAAYCGLSGATHGATHRGRVKRVPQLPHLLPMNSISWSAEPRQSTSPYREDARRERCWRVASIASDVADGPALPLGESPGTRSCVGWTRPSLHVAADQPP